MTNKFIQIARMALYNKKKLPTTQHNIVKNIYSTD